MSVEPQPLRLLFFDVETSLSEVRTFPSKRPQYIHYKQVKVPQYMHCWAAQWEGQQKIHSARQTSEESLARDDTRIVTELADLVRQADYVVAHNADQFDIPKLRNRLIVGGLEPLGPVQSIDTLKMARKLGFSHNHLGALSIALGSEGKMDNPEGLWDQAFDGSDVALRHMLRYCKQDVEELAFIYSKLRPHAVRLPRLVDGVGSHCPTCGSLDYQKRGVRRTNAGNSQQYRCNKCGGYFTDKTSDAGRRQMRPA